MLAQRGSWCVDHSVAWQWPIETQNASSDLLAGPQLDGEQFLARERSRHPHNEIACLFVVARPQASCQERAEGQTSR
jgi:hypothetical protein